MTLLHGCLLLAGLGLAPSLQVPLVWDHPPPVQDFECKPEEDMPSDPSGAEVNVDFNGKWLFTALEGDDPQKLYEAMGVPAILRAIPPLFNYGIGILWEEIFHDRDFMAVRTVVDLGGLPPTNGSEGYTVGYSRSTEHGFDLCGMWNESRNAISMRAVLREGKQPTSGPKIRLPVSTRYIDEDGRNLLEGELDGIYNAMVFTKIRKKPKRRPRKEPPSEDDEDEDDGLMDVYNVPGKVDRVPTPEEALAFAQLMEMGALPPFIPMKLEPGWAEVVRRQRRRALASRASLAQAEPAMSAESRGTMGGVQPQPWTGEPAEPALPTASLEAAYETPYQPAEPALPAGSLEAAYETPYQPAEPALPGGSLEAAYGTPSWAS